jgi:hypothetical protein
LLAAVIRQKESLPCEEAFQHISFLPANYHQYTTTVTAIAGQLDDIEAAITETFAAFERVRKKKDQVDSQRLWSFFGFALMMIGIITVKGLLPSIGFFCGIIIAMLFFSKAQKAASPLAIEIKAYEGVLLKLHEMKIMREQIGRGSG